MGFFLGFFLFVFFLNACNVTKKYLNLNVMEGPRLQESRHLKAKKAKLFLQQINSREIVTNS